mgnify:CR=1 FL=1
MENVNITYLWRGKKTVLGLPIGATKYAVSEEKIIYRKRCYEYRNRGSSIKRNK